MCPDAGARPPGRSTPKGPRKVSQVIVNAIEWWSMLMARRFDPEVLRTLAEIDEVEIEPRQPDGGSVGPVTIWVVVDGDDVYVRSYRGSAGRWYQALTAHPEGVLHAGQLDIPFRAVPVTDPATLERVSEAYRRKYERKWPQETAGMVTDEVLPTTLRLEPA
jgi:hypothetical protein